VVRGFGPDEWSGIFVIGLQVIDDSLFQLACEEWDIREILTLEGLLRMAGYFEVILTTDSVADPERLDLSSSTGLFEGTGGG
jgi:hypothetical protein